MKHLGLGAISAAVLLLEITLTRVYSVTQGYHFAFLAVSLGLLGFGVSGTVLFVVPRLWLEGWHRLLPVSALLFSVTALGSYWAINRIPFDAYRVVYCLVNSFTWAKLCDIFPPRSSLRRKPESREALAGSRPSPR